MTRHYLYCLAENLLQAIRSTTHIWVVTRHRYGNFAPVSQTSFRGENSAGVAKFRLFSQAIQTAHKTALHNERTKYSYRQNAKPRKWNVTHHFSLHVTDQVLFSAICVGAKCHPSTRGRSRKIVLLLIFKLPAEEHVLLRKFKWHAHGWADDAITRQNLIKILTWWPNEVIPRNKLHAYQVTISFSLSPCLHRVKLGIASIQGNFLSLAFKLFVFAKKGSVLIGSHRISFPYLINYVHSSTTKENSFCDEKS